MLASWRSVAKLCRTSRDRLHEPSDWNESNPRKVVAVQDEVVLEALGAACACISLRSRRGDGFEIIIAKTRGACVIAII
jgi:hypothetical protein